MREEDKYLDPCPFCGGKAEIMKTPLDNYWVQCTDCGIMQGWSENNIDNAIETWNTRKEGKK